MNKKITKKKKKKGLFVRATLYFIHRRVKILTNYINIYILKKYFKEQTLEYFVTISIKKWMHISSLIGESKKNKKHQSSREENKEEVEGFVEKKNT